jgi:hypothetical protein
VRSRRAVGALRRLALRLADLPSAAGAGSLAAGSAVEALALDAAAVYIQRSAA